MFQALVDEDEVHNSYTGQDLDIDRKTKKLTEGLTRDKLSTNFGDENWYDNNDLFNIFCNTYVSVFSLPKIEDKDISFVSEIPDSFIDDVNFFGDIELKDAIRKFDRDIYDESVHYISRKTTMKEFFFYTILRTRIRFERSEDYAKMEKVLSHNRLPIRLSAIIGVTYDEDKIDLSNSFPFLSQNTQSRYVSCSYLMKYLGRNNMLNIDFPEYYSEDKKLKKFDLDKMVKDQHGIVFYRYLPLNKNKSGKYKLQSDIDKKFSDSSSKNKRNNIDQNKLSREKIRKVINYNRLIAILSYLKFLTFDMVFEN